MSAQHVETIQQVYAAFGRGDVPSILDRVTDDTVWRFNVQRSEVPWHRPIQGKANLPQFFAALGEGAEFRRFEPQEFIDRDRHVVSHVHMTYVIRRTGKEVDEDALFWWTMSPEGKIQRLVHYEDTAQVLDAYRG